MDSQSSTTQHVKGKTKTILRNFVAKPLAALMLYVVTSVGLNISTTIHHRDSLSVVEANELIRTEQEKFYFQDKKINFITLEGMSLWSRYIGGLTYSSEGEFYIVHDEKYIKKIDVLHELGHVIASRPRKDKFTLEDSLNEVENTEYNFGRLIKYALSPEELFCNIYALAKN